MRDSAGLAPDFPRHLATKGMLGAVRLVEQAKGGRRAGLRARASSRETLIGGALARRPALRPGVHSNAGITSRAKSVIARLTSLCGMPPKLNVALKMSKS